MSFRLKTILGVAAIEALLLLLLVWSSLSFLNTANETAIADRVQSTISLAVSSTKDAVLSNDLAYLESYVSELLSNPGIVYARVRDGSRVLAEAGDSALLARRFRADVSLAVVDDDVFDARGLVQEAGLQYGAVEIGLSVARIRQTFGDAGRQIGLIAVLELVLVGIFSFVLGTYLTRQLRVLSDASARMAEGDLGVQIPVQGSDELASTARAFNLMSQRVARSHENLRAAYHGIVAGVSEGIITLDGGGRILELNPAAEHIFGLPSAQAAGRHISEWIPAPFDVGERPHTFREFGGRRADGTTLDLEASVSALSLGDEGAMLACIVRDVSLRKRSERQLAESARRLEAQNKELQDFAYVASHDLQEPLRKVQAYGDILRNECAAELSDEGQRYVSRMLSSTERMQSLINDLLAYSRVSTRRESFGEVRLGKVVDDVLADLEVAISESGADVRVDELPTIRGDATQMRQLFQNLIANAIKFRRPGGTPRVTVASAPLLLELPGEDRVPGYRITVSDNGIGFSPSYAERIFEVFERLHGRHDYPGTGIGLAICRKITQRHHGSIRAEAIEGEGATFEVALPGNPGVFREAGDEC